MDFREETEGENWDFWDMNMEKNEENRMDWQSNEENKGKQDTFE